MHQQQHESILMATTNWWRSKLGHTQELVKKKFSFFAIFQYSLDDCIAVHGAGKQLHLLFWESPHGTWRQVPYQNQSMQHNAQIRDNSCSVFGILHTRALRIYRRSRKLLLFKSIDESISSTEHNHSIIAFVFNERGPTTNHSGLFDLYFWCHHQYHHHLSIRRADELSKICEMFTGVQRYLR